MREEQDPSLAIRRTRQHYARLGYSSEWIDARMATLESREAVTAEWSMRGADERRDFAHLTETLHTHTFDISTGAHKALKGLRNQQLRDNMSPMELILTALGEETARMVHVNEDSQGVAKLASDVASAGDIAGAAREQIEQLTGQRVVTAENATTLRLGRQRELQPTLLPLPDDPDL